MSDDVSPSFWDSALEFVFQTADGNLAQDAAIQHFSVGPSSPVEAFGTKQSQRSELSETQTSDDANTGDGPIWYHWSVYIDPVTKNPSQGGNAAKVHFGQFHQRTADGISDTPALMFNLLENGDLVAQFENELGKRAHVLVSGGIDGESAKGHWIDIVVGADWKQSGGWTEFYIREQGETDFRLLAYDDGPNTTTGKVYFKYGIYRSFVERDPVLAESTSAASYSDVIRAKSADELFLQMSHSESPEAKSLDVGEPALSAIDEISSLDPQTFFVDYFDFG